MRLRMGTDAIGLKQGDRPAIWFKAIRFHYVPPSFLPAILGSLIAWCSGYRPDMIGFFLVVIGVTVNHCGLNMLDDVCDYLHQVDRSVGEERNPYTGGSGVLTEGLLSPKQVAAGAALCFFLTSLIGVYLTSPMDGPYWPSVSLVCSAQSFILSHRSSSVTGDLANLASWSISDPLSAWEHTMCRQGRLQSSLFSLPSSSA